MPIPLFNTYVASNAIQRVSEVLGTTFLSEGKLVAEFEGRLERELGLQRPVAVNSGTSSLHLALALAGIGPGDEVILPAQTFVATGLVVLQERATPVFADIRHADGNLDPADVERRITGRTRAIMPVHWAGYPCDMAAIGDIARRHGLVVIEDAAHALGATYRGMAIGGLSDFTCFSFQAIKHLTTGDGGAVCCGRESDFPRARARRWFGIDRATSRPSHLGERAYDISEVGFKYHMNDYAAALGLANLDGYGERLARRQRIATIYRAAFESVAGVTLFENLPDRESAFWLFGMHVERRDDFIRALLERGVTTSVVHQRIDRNSVFGGRRGDLPEQARFDVSQVHVPLHDALGDEDVDRIIGAVRKGW